PASCPYPAVRPCPPRPCRPPPWPESRTCSLWWPERPTTSPSELSSQAPLATAVCGRYGGRVPLPPSCRGCVPQPSPPRWHDRSDHRVLWPAAPLELARLVGGEAVSSGDRV